MRSTYHHRYHCIFPLLPPTACKPTQHTSTPVRTTSCIRALARCTSTVALSAGMSHATQPGSCGTDGPLGGAPGALASPLTVAGAQYLHTARSALHACVRSHGGASSRVHTCFRSRHMHTHGAVSCAVHVPHTNAVYTDGSCICGVRTADRRAARRTTQGGRVRVHGAVGRPTAVRSVQSQARATSPPRCERRARAP